MEAKDPSLFYSPQKEKEFIEALEKIFLEKDDDKNLSFQSSFFQNHSSYHNVNMSRSLASILVSPLGDIKLASITLAENILERNLFPLGRANSEESPQREHILKSLKKLKNPEIIKLIKTTPCPEKNLSKDLIKLSLNLPSQTRVTIVETRQAMLAALFTFLRQDVGSCFASAPAILIQQQQQERFLDDISQLLLKNKISKTIQGKEFFVPLNTNFIPGDLFKPILIKNFFPNPIDSLSSSPGLLAAFKAINLASDNEQLAALIEENEAIKELLQSPYNTISADFIIKSLLLSFLKVPIKEAKEILSTANSFSLDFFNILSPKKAEDFFYFYKQSSQQFVSLCRNILLKTWEYSLASFTEQDPTFTKHHILTALGINVDDENSIASFIKEEIQNEINFIHKDIETFDIRYNAAKTQLDYLTLRLQRPLNSHDSEMLAAEFRSKKQEVNIANYELQEAQEKILLLTQSFPKIITFYSEEISNYFKSIFDPSIGGTKDHFSFDHPAGFRIFFTNGRLACSVWQTILSLKDWQQSLSSFFSLTEFDLLDKNFALKIKKEISKIIGRLILNVNNPSFITSSIHRLAIHYKIPLSSYEDIKNSSSKPWAYISGGNLDSLLSHYYTLLSSPSSIEKKPETPIELLTFFTETIKDLPPTVSKDYLGKNSMILVTSPKHAFLAKFGSKSFQEAWDNDWFSFTWLRDKWQKKHLDFLDKTILYKRELSFVIDLCLKRFPSLNEFNFEDVLLSHSLSLPEFCSKMYSILNQANVSKDFQNYLAKALPSLLFSSMPLIEEQTIDTKINDISEFLGISSKVNYLSCSHIIDGLVPKFSIITSLQLKNLYKHLLETILQKNYDEEDYGSRLNFAMQSLGLAYPSPLIFADTNWEEKLFGFTVSPANKTIELWTFNFSVTEGSPIPEWDSFFIPGSNSWNLYSDPQDYGENLS